MTQAINTFYVKQHDTLPPIVETLSSGLGPIDLTLATKVEFHLRKGDVVKIADGEVTVVDAEAGIVSYEWQTGDTDTVGTWTREWEITFPNGVMTVPNDRKGYNVAITAELA